LSEPGADRGPRRGSRAGVVVATGSQLEHRSRFWQAGTHPNTSNPVATAPGSDKQEHTQTQATRSLLLSVLYSSTHYEKVLASPANTNTEPGADRGPRRGSRAGVVVATRSQLEHRSRFWQAHTLIQATRSLTQQLGRYSDKKQPGRSDKPRMNADKADQNMNTF